MKGKRKDDEEINEGDSESKGPSRKRRDSDANSDGNNKNHVDNNIVQEERHRAKMQRDEADENKKNAIQVVMPFYDENLRKLLWRQSPVNVSLGLKLLRDVAKALLSLHTAGLLHGSVLPGT